MKKLVKTFWVWIFIQPLLLSANPTGGSSGTASVSSTGNDLTVNVSSTNNVVTWDSFSIDSTESVTFSRTGTSSSYYVWNEVTGSLSSNIQGSLITQGNGNIFLYNQNGIVVGANAIISANSFVATTLDKVGNEFNPTSNMTFQNSTSTTSVNVAGTITSVVGDITIIGYRVINSGTLTAADSVNLAAGRDVTLQPGSNQRVTINTSTSAGTGNGITLSGTINGKSTILVADGNAYALAVNHSGVINSTSCISSEGRIMLIAEDPDATGNGAVTMSGTIKRNASGGSGSSVTILGKTVALTGSASINTSGANGGGNIIIGQSTAPDTDNIHIASGTTITASATTTGNGGNVTMWADNSLIQIGSITSRGAATGNGGAVSLTSPGYLGYNATTNLGGGTTGSAGTLTLTSSAANVGGSANYGSFFAPTSFTSGNITTTNTTAGLQNTLAFSNVSIVADGTDTTGNMAVAADLTWSSGRTLTMNADNILAINNDITMTGTTSSGTTVVSLTAPTINIGTIAKSHTTSRGVDLTSGDIVTAAALTLNVYGGSATSSYARLNTAAGSNTITFGSNMNVVGGDASGAHAEIKGTTVTIDGITANTGDLLVQADDCSQAVINGTVVNFGQTTQFNDLDMMGGRCGSGNHASLGNGGGASTIDIDINGDVTLTGGSSGTNNTARIISSGGTAVPININANSFTVTGGSVGAGNSAYVSSVGSSGTVIIVTAQDLIMTGGGSSATSSSAYIEGTTVNHTVGRDFIINGGSGAVNRAYVYGYDGVTVAVARYHEMTGGSASQAIAEIRTSNGDIVLDGSSAAAALNVTGGSSGTHNAAARLYVTGNGNIYIGDSTRHEYVTFTGGSGIGDVYAHALIGVNGNIHVNAAQDIVLHGGGPGTSHAGWKIIGTGNIDVANGRDVIMNTGTSTESHVFFHAQNGTFNGVHGRDVTMSGSCTIPNDAYIRSDSSNGGITMLVGRNLTQNGLSYITVTGATQLLNLTVVGTHTINDCSYINGGTIVPSVTYPTNDYYAYEFLYELFYKLHYFTNYDWYLMHIDNFWDKMMRTSP